MSILFAVLAILCGFIGCLLAGLLGLGITVLFAVLAVVFAIKKRKTDGKGGIGSIVVSVIGVLFGALIAFGLMGFGASIKENAAKAGYPELEKYGDSFKFGVIGFAKDLAGEDQKEIESLVDKLKAVVEYSTKNS